MATSDSMCSVEECAKKRTVRGMCPAHYQRWRLTGNTELKKKTKVECYVDECTRDARAKGLCNRHYENLRKYGYEVPRRDWSIERTLDDTGWIKTDAGCWEWKGSRNDFGYGVVDLTRKGLFNARVHRLMYERFVGEIPEGFIVRHTCDNPPCSNPDHLEIGTQLDNVHDMFERGRHWRHGATECLNGHDLTEPGSYRMAKREGRRDEKVCLACQRERHLRWQENKKLERAKPKEAS